MRGSIPDMTSDSDRYIQLQNAYREQAVADVASVITHVHSLTSAVGMVCGSCFIMSAADSVSWSYRVSICI